MSLAAAANDLLGTYSRWRESHACPKLLLLNLTPELPPDLLALWSRRFQIAAGLPCSPAVLELRLRRCLRLQRARNSRAGFDPIFRARESLRELYQSLPERAFIANYLSEAEFIERGFDTELRLILSLIEPQPDLPALIQTARSDGCKVAITAHSSLGTDGIRKCCIAWDLDRYISNYFISADELQSLHTGHLLSAAEQVMGVSPQSSLVIGPAVPAAEAFPSIQCDVTRATGIAPALDATLATLFSTLVQQGTAEFFFVAPECGNLPAEVEAFQRQLLMQPALLFSSLTLDSQEHQQSVRPAVSKVPLIFIARQWTAERQNQVKARFLGRDTRFFAAESATSIGFEGAAA